MRNEATQLSFDNICESRRRTARQRRLSRAGWWFDRMRQVVDRAVDWQPAPAPRPQQILFPNAVREICLPRCAEETQVCE